MTQKTELKIFSDYCASTHYDVTAFEADEMD